MTNPIMHVALVHDCFPWPTFSGASSRIASLIEHLHDKGISVTLIVSRERHKSRKGNAAPIPLRVEYFRPPGIAHFIRRLKWAIDDLLEGVGLPTIDSLLLKALGSKLAYRSSENWDQYPAGLDRFVEKLHNRNKFDAIVVEYIWMHPAVSRVRGKVPLMLDMHDLMHKRAEEFRRNGLVYSLDITREQELAIFDQFDATIAIQESEADLIEQAATRSTVVRTGVDTFDPLPLPDARSGIEILYLGGINPCNVDGISWFLREVWPEVFQRHPTATLVIGGNVCKPLAELHAADSSKGVKLVGFVHDLQGLYASTNICINPINFGSGLKIKTVEALGRGRPLVTTPVGIDGIRPDPSHACFVVSGADQWIDALDSLCASHDVRAAYARAAAEYASEWLSADHIYSAMTNWLWQLDTRRSEKLETFL